MYKILDYYIGLSSLQQQRFDTVDWATGRATGL